MVQEGGVIEGDRYPRRSISQFKTYTRCGELYRIERVEGADEVPAAWTALGTAFHSAYEHWELSERTDSFEANFVEAYDKEIEQYREQVPDLKEWSSPPGMSVVTSIQHYRKRGITKDVPLYEAHCRESDWTWEALELPFEITLGGVTVRGAIDRIEQDCDGYFFAQDLKTGSPEDEDDIRQTSFYGYVANKMGYPVELVRYWYTKVNRGSNWVRPIMSDDYWTEQFDMLNRGIEGAIFLPNPGKKCGLCPHQSKTKRCKLFNENQ